MRSVAPSSLIRAGRGGRSRGQLKPVTLYVVLASVTTVLVVTGLLRSETEAGWPDVLLLVALASTSFVAEHFSVRLHRDWTSAAGTLPHLAAVVLLPAGLAAIAGMLGTCLYCALRRLGPAKVALNTASVGMSIAVAGGVVALFGGRAEMVVPGNWASAPVGALATGVYLLISILSVATAVALDQNRPIWRLIRPKLGIPILADVALGCTGVAIAVFLHQDPAWSLALLLPSWLVYAAHRNELALRLSQAHLQSVLDNAQDAIVLFDGAGSILLFNKAAQRMFNVSEDSSLGHPIDELIPGATQLRARGQLRARRASGDFFPIEVTLTDCGPGRDDDHLYTLIGRDVTERERELEQQRFLGDASRKLEEAALDPKRALSEIARLAAERINDACVIWLLSQDGQRLEIAACFHQNDAARELLQNACAHRSPADLPLVHKLLTTGQAELCLQPTTPTFLAAQDDDAAAAAYMRQIGIASVIGVPLRLHDRVTGVLVLARDSGNRPYTTADQALLQELADRLVLVLQTARLYDAEQAARQEAQRSAVATQSALRLRDEFLSIAAHELRTPVTSIKLAAQMLSHSGPGASPLESDRTLSILEMAATHLAELTEDLLDLARLQSGRMKLNLGHVDLALLVRQTVKTYEVRIRRTHRIEVIGGERALGVEADAIRLQQVVSNLIDNAVKYSPEGSTITVAMGRMCGDGCALHVSDQGIGLPPGAETTIFEPFGRASNAAASHIQGMGLGLHVCRQIVDLHAGQLWAHSPGEMQGTTFHLRLPTT